MFCTVACVGVGGEIARAEVSDAKISEYYRAVDICRRITKRPMALDLDKRVLCFDGQILTGLDVSIAERLEDGGLFVVRSLGGSSISAINLAEVLWERHATVVVYDYCFSACASFLLVASTKTFVLRHTLVAWHHTVGPHLCPSLEKAKDNGPGGWKRTYAQTRLLGITVHTNTEKSCLDGSSVREATALFEDPPQSSVVREILQNKFGERGDYPANLTWTWHPRYYGSNINTNITYEAYPQSQDEVDAMADWLEVRVVYDP